MHPILIRFGSFTVYSYGVMVAIGFALAVACIYRRAPKFNLEKEKAVDLAIVILISGILGARLLYILLNASYYIANPLEMIMLSKGGLVWYGGFALALAAMVIYLRLNRLSFWPVVDLLAPYVAMAQGFGRIGCFLNGCCYGIEYAPGSRLPVQLISAGLLFLIFAVLRSWQNRRRFEGEIFLAYCILYSCKRFFVEFLRGDNPKILFGLTISQIISFGFFLAALLLFLHKALRWKE